MGHERWVRGQHDGQERPFDWLTPARQHGIPWERAQALYEQAVRRAREQQHASAGLLQEIYLALLVDARQQAARPTPGKVTRTMRLQSERAGKQPRVARTSPLTGQTIKPGARTLTSYLTPTRELRRPDRSSGIEHEHVDMMREAFLRRSDPMRHLPDSHERTLDILLGVGPTDSQLLGVGTDDREEPWAGESADEEPWRDELLSSGADPDEQPWDERPWIVADAGEATDDRPSRHLPKLLRARMERAFGQRFDHVRIHRGSSMPAGRQAFTRGHDIHLGPDAPAPGSPEGERIVAHELAHVAQRSLPTTPWQLQPPSIAALELDAHQAALHALAGQAAAVRQAAPAGLALGYTEYPDALDAEAAADEWLDEELWNEPEEATLSENSEARQEREVKTAAELEREADAAADAVAGAGSRPTGARPRGGASQLAALDPDTRSQMESAFGTGFGDVRLHTDTESARAVESMEALAYASGSDITFAEGWYAPGTSEGDWLLAHELAHVVQHRRGQLRAPAAFAVTRAAAVPSLHIEDHRTRVLPQAWDQLEAKLLLRDARVAERLRLVTAGSPQAVALQRMQSRWATFRRLVNTPSFDPATGRLPAVSAIDDARTEERADTDVLTGRPNRMVRAESRAFLSALRHFLAQREILVQERAQYRRFDELFVASEVQTLLAAITLAAFTPADVKALVDQETGDLTNTAVAGITGKQEGITERVPNPAHFVGLGQQSPGARDEAIRWASVHGVTIPRSPDPRLDPARAIQLTAAYMGHITENLLYPDLPAPKPTGDELKKLVFAAYNGGFATVLNAVASFQRQRGRSRSYTWDEIKNQPGITGQMRNYVAKIVRRLS